jgi:hypothetical protein
MNPMHFLIRGLRQRITFGVGLLLTACANPEATMTSQPENSAKQSLEMQERLQEESRIIADMLAQLPEGDRATAKREMEQYFDSVRGEAPATATRERVTTPLVRVGAKQQTFVRVVVALVPTLGNQSSRSTVIRRPNDGGTPTLLLRESDVTDEDLRRGLRAAALTFQRYGAAPARELKLSLRSTTGARPMAPRREGMKSPLEYLKTAPVRDMPGLGPVKWMYIATPLLGSR